MNIAHFETPPFFWLLQVSHCHDSVVYILAPLKYVSVFGCSDSIIVLGAVGKVSDPSFALFITVFSACGSWNCLFDQEADCGIRFHRYNLFFLLKSALNVDLCCVQAVRVEHCERIQLIVPTARITIANCRECVFYLGVNQRPLFTGDNHHLQVQLHF